MTDYLRAFLRFDPPAIRRAVPLNFAAALTEGAGLLMLLPLLSLAGVLEQGGGQKGWIGGGPGWRTYASKSTCSA